jgi:hypothetical protein
MNKLPTAIALGVFGSFLSFAGSARTHYVLPSKIDGCTFLTRSNVVDVAASLDDLVTESAKLDPPLPGAQQAFKTARTIWADLTDGTVPNMHFFAGAHGTTWTPGAYPTPGTVLAIMRAYLDASERVWAGVSAATTWTMASLPKPEPKIRNVLQLVPDYHDNIVGKALNLFMHASACSI